MIKNRIGIVGGGQLGRMLAFEAKKMGFTVSVLDPTPKSPAGQVVDRQIIAHFKDEKAILELAKISDYLTLEIELANSKILDELSKNGVKVNPSAKTLDIIKDKLKQKEFLKNAKLPVADFTKIKDKNDLLRAIKHLNYPVVLKARFDGYDGRGNAVIEKEEEIDKALEKLENRSLYVEKFVYFIKELAIMVARSTKGEIKVYSVVETVHKNNICHIVKAPAPIDEKVRRKAKILGIKTMEQLKGAGVFGIEMFLTKKGEILINEIAPRVHNSGHYTIEACLTSQFEQHIRAITGMPLGSSEMIVPAAAMINILGDRKGETRVKGIEKALSLPNVYVHIYGKIETKPERKMGHITAIDKTINKALAKAIQARSYISI